MKIAVFQEPLGSQYINKKWDNWILSVNDGKPFAIASLTQQIVMMRDEYAEDGRDSPVLCAVLTYVPQSQTGIVGATLGNPANGVRA